MEQSELFPELCGWANVDGSSCSLLPDHKGLHDFSVAPPDEYYELEAAA